MYCSVWCRVVWYTADTGYLPCENLQSQLKLQSNPDIAPVFVRRNSWQCNEDGDKSKYCPCIMENSSTQALTGATWWGWRYIGKGEVYVSEFDPIWCKYECKYRCIYVTLLFRTLSVSKLMQRLWSTKEFLWIIGGMTPTGENRSQWHFFFVTNSIWTGLGSNPCLWCERPAISHPIHYLSPKHP
jgi:hypothetical protein